MMKNGIWRKKRLCGGASGTSFGKTGPTASPVGMTGRSVCAGIWRGVAVFGLGAVLAGCESDTETIVYETYVPVVPAYEVVEEEVYVETYFEVVDEYGVVVEEVEVTWETLPATAYEETTDVYASARRARGQVVDEGGQASVPLPANPVDEILFRFSKPGYVDVWASSADMIQQEQDGRVVLEHNVVLARK